MRLLKFVSDLCNLLLIEPAVRGSVNLATHYKLKGTALDYWLEVVVLSAWILVIDRWFVVLVRRPSKNTESHCILVCFPDTTDVQHTPLSRPNAKPPPRCGDRTSEGRVDRHRSAWEA